MVIGLIGSGNMATALARGLKEPVVCTDLIPEKATQLAAEVGGEAVADNKQLAEKADLVVLCHKPAQLEKIAAETGGKAKAILSILAGVKTDQLAAVYGNIPIYRIMPNTAVAIGRGVICLAPPLNSNEQITEELTVHLRNLGTLVEIDEKLMETATAVIGVGPAYIALIAEAWADAAVRHGLSAAQASELVYATLAGSSELLPLYEHDTLAMRRAVTSPGGVTARGIAALEDAGLRAAFANATDAVLGKGPS